MRLIPDYPTADYGTPLANNHRPQIMGQKDAMTYYA